MSKYFSVFNPVNEFEIAQLAYLGYEDTILVIEKAQAAFLLWKSLMPKQRAKILEKWYDLLVQAREELAKILELESGKPFQEALSEVDYANSFVKYYANEVLQIHGEASPYFREKQWSLNILEPIGVVGAITPWNFPAAMVTKKISPALASGCSVVLKPSEETPLSAIKIRELAIEAGVPNDAFTIVYGNYQEIGKALTEHPQVKMISFTGSVEVGKYLMRECAATVKKIVLELGGNAPCIVMQDADLELAVKKIVSGKFRNAGQACTAPNRIYVHEDIFEKFSLLLIAEIKQGKHEIGPLINKAAKRKSDELLQDAINNGAQLLLKDKIPIDKKESKLYCAPVVLSNLDDETRIVKEEAFSPFLSLLKFSSKEEVIARANNSVYGLAAYLFTSNLKLGLECAQQLNFGVVAINETSTAADVTVHGGYNQSGLGREGGKSGLLEYYENKFIVF